MSTMRIKTPKKTEVNALADAQDRWGLIEKVLSHIPLGTRRIADAPKVLAANCENAT